MTRMPVGRNGDRPLRSEEPPSRGCSGGCSMFADLRDDFVFPGAFIGCSARFRANCASVFAITQGSSKPPQIETQFGAFPDGRSVRWSKLTRIVGIALRKLGLSGLETVMIGGTPYDAEAASEAGAAAAGVLIEGFSIDSLRGAGCFAIADEIS